MSSPTDLTLAADGRTGYRIVIAAGADEPTQAAAETLANHLQKITGADFPIALDSGRATDREIVVGDSDRLARLSPPIDVASLADEEYVIRTHGSRLFIAGGRRHGTAFGVYVFLEDHLGCRWYAPDCTVVPSRPTLNLGPIDVRAKPFFEARMLAERRDSFATDAEWSAAMRINGHDYGAAGDPMLTYFNETQEEASYQRDENGTGLSAPLDPVAVGVPPRID